LAHREPAERHKFPNLFADRLVRFYGRRLAQSGDGDFVVTDSRTGSDRVVVISQIVPRQGASITIGWRLGLSDGVYKIQDVAIDGVSMASAQRSEIAAFIARGGGQLRMLRWLIRRETEECRRRSACASPPSRSSNTGDPPRMT